MPGLGGALDIARWSMYSSQLAMEIVSHNVANANTEGYSRQSLRVEAGYPITMGPGQIGTGVRAVEVLRNYDNFLNQQVTLKKSEYSFWSASRSAMEEIESIFNETDGYGLNYLMGEFWNAWGDLSNNPDGVPERQALVNKTENLLSMIHEIDYNLRSYQRHLDGNIRGSVTEVNSIIRQIADLNKSISSVEIDGMINANDLRDRRELLLEQLSQYMDITYYEEESTGQVQVYIMGGTPLVLGYDTYEFVTSRNDATGFTDIFWQDSSGRQVNVTDKLRAGKIAGWVNVRDNTIGSYIDSLNTMVGELVWRLNEIHSQGVGLAGVTSMESTVGGMTAASDLSSDFLFSDRYVAGAFEIIVYDSSGQVAGSYHIDPAGTTIGDLVNEINAESGVGGPITASITAEGRFRIDAGTGYTFAVAPAATGTNGNALAVMGVNTFFSWNETVGSPLDDITETIGLNDAVAQDPTRISTGRPDASGLVAPGSNVTARQIYSLQDLVIPDIGGTGVSTTLDAFYSSLVAQVGVDVQNSINNEKFNDTLLGQYLRRKESVTGVNIDDEMAELIKLQHLYQASAKLISVADEMMEALISIK
ncbi:MAG TPA: flagellar hook-associated protein FlgK [Deltaproteobacteria bacterium]|nr:flagellar hook-associated protein FlgK [Deltaproteobacteria bacterium]HOM29280.1 flagellar hook-associated protein FlgK [Deltaproteobacteria bacterium]HPP80858.1 flagellar hook-associated protein FlgK [Deltaproteobacteria bacterium]